MGGVGVRVGVERICSREVNELKVERALQELHEKGLKLTGKREQMLRLLAQEDRFMNAKEVMERMQRDYPGISVDTIYRNLTSFVKLNLLEETELNGERFYRFCCEKPDTHHHHFICAACGKTEAIQACPVTWPGLTLPSGYSISGHKFEVYGRCPKCQQG